MEQNLPPQDPIVSVNNQSLQPAQKPKRKLHLPGIAILIGFFILLFALMEGGLYLAKKSNNNTPLLPTPMPVVHVSPTPVPDKVQTYIGDGFSFNYPAELTQNQKTGNSEILTSDFYGMQIDNQSFPFKNLKEKDSFTIYRFNGSESNTYKMEVDSVSEIIPVGTNVTRYSIGCGVDCGFFVLEFKSNGKYYRIYFDGAGGGLSKRFDGLVSSFAFTNSTSTGSTGSSTVNPGQTEPADPVMVACTMEAKLCPDGKTSVGRSGPNCEFAKCPGE
jgi:hypothetical protein